MTRDQGASRGASSAARGTHPAHGNNTSHGAHHARGNNSSRGAYLARGYNTSSTSGTSLSSKLHPPPSSRMTRGHGASRGASYTSTAPVGSGHGVKVAAPADLFAGAQGSTSANTAETITIIITSVNSVINKDSIYDVITKLARYCESSRLLYIMGFDTNNHPPPSTAPGGPGSGEIVASSAAPVGPGYSVVVDPSADLVAGGSGPVSAITADLAKINEDWPAQFFASTVVLPVDFIDREPR
jgi:hypothetical protein